MDYVFLSHSIEGHGAEQSLGRSLDVRRALVAHECCNASCFNLIALGEEYGSHSSADRLRTYLKAPEDEVRKYEQDSVGDQDPAAAIQIDQDDDPDDE